MKQEDSSSRIPIYRAAAERLGEARESAIKRRMEAENIGDVVAGQQALDELRIALNEFKEIRKTLDSRELFLVRFNIEEVSYGRISLVLPKGISRIEFLDEAQSIVGEYYDKSSIVSNQLQKWRTEDRFKEVVPEPLRLEIQGIVQGTTYKGVDDQRRHLAKEGFALPTKRDLVVAHAAHFVATGRSMLSDLAIRTSDGCVRCYPYGLEQEEIWANDLPFTFVAAAGSPASPVAPWWRIFKKS